MSGASMGAGGRDRSGTGKAQRIFAPASKLWDLTQFLDQAGCFAPEAELGTAAKNGRILGMSGSEGFRHSSTKYCVRAISRHRILQATLFFTMSHETPLMVG